MTATKGRLYNQILLLQGDLRWLSNSNKFSKKYFLKTLHKCTWNFPETPWKSKKLSWDTLETSCKNIWKLLKYDLNCTFFGTLDALLKYFRNLLKRKEKRKKKRKVFSVKIQFGKLPVLKLRFLPQKVVYFWRYPSIEDQLPSKVCLQWRSSSIIIGLPSTIDFYQRSSSLKGHLPKIIFQKLLSSIKGRCQSKVFFPLRLYSIKYHLSSKGFFYQRLSSNKCCF